VTRLPQASFDEALDWILASSTWWGAHLRVRLGAWPDGEVIYRRWRAPGVEGDLSGMVRWLDEEHDDEVLLGLPVSRKGDSGPGRTSLLWARIEGEKQLAWAKRHRPLPSMILQEGSSTRRWLLWMLERPVTYFEAVKLNRRLAYRFRGVQARGEPDGLWLPAPGTCLRDGRARPVPVRVSRMTLDTWWPEDVAGALRDPPEQQWGAAGR
jgi:hypothetical protein